MSQQSDEKTPEQPKVLGLYHDDASGIRGRKGDLEVFLRSRVFKQVENACSFIIDNSLDENHLDSRWSLRHSA